MTRINKIQNQCREDNKALQLMFTSGIIQFSPLMEISIEDSFMEIRIPGEDKLVFTVRVSAFLGAGIGQALTPVQASPILVPQVTPIRK